MNISFFKLKGIYGKLFLYPVQNIEISQSGDYDVYWKDKRGVNIGTLSMWQKERADFILNTLPNTQEKIAISDIGCGDGSILVYLRSRNNNIYRCIGYDDAEFALKQARTEGIETHKLDIAQKASYPYIQETDYCLLLEVLEHIPESETLLTEALTKSRQGVFFSFPNTGYIRHRIRLLFGKFPLQWRVFPNEHVRFWTYSDLRWWLRALGMSKYRIQCYQGVPILNKIWPSLFAAAFIVYLAKE